MRIVKKIARILAIIIVSIILLNIIIIITFSVPRVQKYAADFALSKLKPIVNTELSIDKIRIRGLNSVLIEGLYVEDQEKDTLFYAGKVGARVNVMDLLQNQLTIQAATISDFTAKVHRETPDTPFNFQFLIDAFASDSTKEKKPSEKPFKLNMSNIHLKNGNLRFDIRSKPETPGHFNPDHLHAANFNLKTDITFLDTKNFIADIHTLSFLETHAGIKVDDLQTMARAKDTKLWSNRVDLKLNNSRLKVTKAEYDTYSKAFSLTAKSTMIDPKDAAIFSDRLTHLNKQFAFEADLTGKLPAVEIKNLTAQYGDQTAFTIKGLISDYEKFGRADIDVDINNLKTNTDDLQALMRIGTPDFLLPEQVTALKNIQLNLKAKGKLSAFHVNMQLKTNPGAVSFKGAGSADNQFNNMTLSGDLATNNLQIAQILGDEIGVDDLSLNTFAKVQIRKNKPLSITARGNIASVMYNNYRYNNIHVDGLYSGNNISGTVSTHTEDNKFHLNADMKMGKPLKIKVNGVIDKLFLSPLFTVESWKNTNLTARINAELQGSDIDTMVGTVVIDSASLYDDNFIYNPGAIYLQAMANDTTGVKSIQLFSSVLEGEIVGNYHFSSIGNQLINVLQPHLPTLIKPTEAKSDFSNNAFTFDFLMKNTEDLSYAFSLPFINVEPGRIKGNVDMASNTSIVLDGNFPRLMVGNNDIRGTKFDLTSGANSGINFNANTYLSQESGHVNVRLNTSALNDSVTNRIFFEVQNNVAQANGNFHISAGFSRNELDKLITNIGIHQSEMLFNKGLIKMLPSTIVYQQDRIDVKGFSMEQDGMMLLGIDGTASKNPDESIRAFFNDTELGTLLAAVNAPALKGSINGSLVIHQALGEPMIQTQDFKIESLRTETDTLGTFYLDGNWDGAKSGLNIDANLIKNQINYMKINGFVPTGETNPMDLKINLNNLPLAWVQPFTVDAFSQLSGTVNSAINLSGKLSEPVTDGWIGIDDGLMTVAFTNVTYTISDTINISPGNIGLNNLIIRDNNNHEAHLNVALTHRNFGGMEYRVNLRLHDFLLLNNENRTDLMAYGNLKLSGNLDLVGSSRGIFGNANLRNESRSSIMIEIPQTATAAENNGVIYINTKNQIEDSLAFLRKNENVDNRINTRLNTGIPINIQMLLNLNSQLEAGVIINPSTGDALEINGNGEIRVNFDSQANPSVRLFGDYVAESGKFRYNLLELRPINFKLKEGSTVTMIGDPMSTQFNITAYNEVTADLATLSESFSTQMKNTRVPVHANLIIQGNLERMNLQYGIELPESATDIQQMLNSLINTDEQKIRQFGYLIATGNFYSAEGTPDLTFGDNAFTTLAASALTKGLDALFARALNNNWKISTNLQTTDGSFDNARMGVDISGKLFDDRLRFTGNVSYGDNKTMASQQAFMGEFELEYDINNWLMIRAYNRANERFYKPAPTTQGVGLVIRRDSRKFKDLFKFSLRKRDDED